LLGRLYIENIAVIERAEIDFCRGFNVLTGETGAGKSILIDSIMAVLGERTSRDLIRTGESSAYVSAEFRDIGQAALRQLAALGIEPENDTVLLVRELKADGRGTCRINGRPVNVSALKSAGQLLINIHGQHDNQALLDPQRHLGYLDSMLADEQARPLYNAAYADFVRVQRELNAATSDENEKQHRIEVLNQNISFIEAAAPQPGELEALQQQRDMYLNFERIRDMLSLSYALMAGEDDTPGTVSALQQTADAIGSVSDCLEDGNALLERVRNAAYEMEDIAEELRSRLDGLEYDPQALERLESRIALLKKIIKRYGGEAEALAFRDKAVAELQNITLGDERRTEIKKRLAVCRQKAVEAGARLSRARREEAVRFSESICEQLRFLDMPSVRFEVSIQEKTLGADGGEIVEFLISTNPGETPKPIQKIASGGELSRIMLAIKNVLADKDDIDSLIFDEIDTGVSGRAAHKIGIKLREVSRSRQIICITHLAQIAANADAHMLIKKTVSDDRTFTSVTRLDYDQRVHELAVINGGDRITDTMLATAEELLLAAGIKREQDAEA